MAKGMTIRTHMDGPSGYRLDAAPKWQVIQSGVMRFRRFKTPIHGPYGLVFALCLALVLWALIAFGFLALR